MVESTAGIPPRRLFRYDWMDVRVGELRSIHLAVILGVGYTHITMSLGYSKNSFFDGTVYICGCFKIRSKVSCNGF